MPVSRGVLKLRFNQDHGTRVRSAPWIPLDNLTMSSMNRLFCVCYGERGSDLQCGTFGRKGKDW